MLCSSPDDALSVLRSGVLQMAMAIHLSIAISNQIERLKCLVCNHIVSRFLLVAGSHPAKDETSLLFYFNITDLKNSEKWALNFGNKRKVSLPELFQYETLLSLVGTCDVCLSIILKTRMNQLNCAVFHLTRICQLWPKTILKVRGGASHRKRETCPCPWRLRVIWVKSPKLGDECRCQGRAGLRAS